ncbi:NLI interacting factor-like phosphatase-domain-containing protein [Dactylonectria macrodidyma]|uniref:NLI interacting factor-like phosphatase-domain-containing protein n=1 Tax=Dactylonectria macrodidyma TaxID=307937 RepID=A0A9P9EYK1_9HYPO|nr:NLI interacting factor-like phosphatase-domain-containing protein [Dactylonectria macrodidyma]
MNSLNIITARVSPPSSPTQSRSNSIGSIGIGIAPEDRSHDQSDDRQTALGSESFPEDTFDESRFDTEKSYEETPLLGHSPESDKRDSWWHTLPRGIASSLISSIRWVFATLASPGVYLIACFYDEDGFFAPLAQLGKLFGIHQSQAAKKSLDDSYPDSEKPGYGRTSGYRSLSPRPAISSGSSSSGMSTESESEESRTGSLGRHARSKSLQPSEELSPARRSIRIKLSSDEALRQRKHRKTQSAVARTKASDIGSGDISSHLKSPTSPIAALTKYPKTPAPPQPLIPRRQPSYLNIEIPKHQQKTLILDLDETLIHSMSKGGRMSTGHMVEVRLNTTYVAVGGQTSIGPQHPILYWVNKRPYCDEFLRRVCKWYNLVVFTASVQEYADPVIDWLEQERKFFSARYYRQHCTFRQGAFIKDLSAVESDLSKVMILDNSPLSYLFHQDNAIPIQGWINDPTDTDLMHLVPLLEGLQYVHDVRALLALRGGEDGQHMA